MIGGHLDRIVQDGIGTNASWRSPAQLCNLFYDIMGLPTQKRRNANGAMVRTSNREAVEKLTQYFIAEPICSHLLALRDLDKKRQFLETGIDTDGRMRTSFNIAGTNTGRLASSMSDFGTGTNLQNVDRDLRSVCISDPGWKFGNLDLEQADSRNLGALCWNLFGSKGDGFAGGYLDLCESGDLHTQVSRMARPELPWTDDPRLNRALADTKFYRNDSYRDLDKKLGHGSNYLGQPRTMAKHAKVPVGEVENFQRNYFRRLPCIPAYHQYVRDEIKEYASLTTLFGRRRFFFGRPSDEATIREAVAYSPQSMTADEIDIGLLRLWQSNRVQLLIQVHDSILFQYPEEMEDEIIPWALEQLRVYVELRGGRKFFVPTEAKVGWNWGDMREDNPDGLVKWKGHDERKRQERSAKLNVRSW
jgi:DNA polymerase-1